MIVAWLGSIFFSIFSRCRRLCLRVLLRIAKRRYPLLRRSGTPIYRLTAGTVLKSGPAWQIRAEVDAMCLVSSHTTIPVPKIYFSWIEGDVGFMVMEFIEGEVLRRAFLPLLTEEQRHHVCRNLAGLLKQLRLIPQSHPLWEPGWIGAARGGPFAEPCLSGGRLPLGPFHTSCEFNDWRVSLYDRFGDIHPPTALRLAELRRRIPDDQRVVFTHGDIHQTNIIVRITGKEAEEVHVAAVLDWGCAGWRPIFWEGYKVRWLSPRPGIWKERLAGDLNKGFESDVERQIEIALIAGGIPPM